MTNPSKTQKDAIPVGPLGPWTPHRHERHLVTPEVAAYLLGHHNTKNRPRSGAIVARLAEELRAGRWVCTSDTIAFEGDGSIRDGQHRLDAAVVANMPIDTWVAFDIPPEAFFVRDQIRKQRSFADILAINKEVNTNLLAAAVALQYRWEEGVRGQNLMSGSISGSVTTYLELLGRHPGLRESCTAVLSCKILGPCRSLAFAHYNFGLRDPEYRDWFFLGLRDGADLEIGNPVLTLRNRLLSQRNSPENAGKKRVNQGGPVGFMAVNLMVRAWNASRSGQKLAKLIVPSKEHNGQLVPDGIPEIK